MKSTTKMIMKTLLLLAGIFVVYSLLRQSSSFSFEFAAKQNQNDPELERIVSQNLEGQKGHFAVYIEELEATDSAKLTAKSTSEESGPTSEVSLQSRDTPLKRYTLNENESFPSASLYKLVLLAAVLKEVEAGPAAAGLTLETMIAGSKSALTGILGDLDFGYEDMPENFEFSVDEALTRVGRISDNFAAIMLTEKLREGSLTLMAQEIGMTNTDFLASPILTTASDIKTYFKALYNGQIVSKQVSEQIIKYLSLSQLNNRIPAQLPPDVKVVHKTGELSRLRHDAGLVFLSDKSQESRVKKDYLIVLLSKDLQFEDEGIETLANISKGVFNYFDKGGSTEN